MEELRVGDGILVSFMMRGSIKSICVAINEFLEHRDEMAISANKNRLVRDFIGNIFFIQSD